MDQQWNDLVNEYVGENHLIVDDKPRNVLQSSMLRMDSPSNNTSLRRSKTSAMGAFNSTG